MNGAIFKIFGATILVFELLLIFAFSLVLRGAGVTGKDLVGIMVVFLGFLIISTMIAIGLICVQRWAAVIASALGLTWSLVVATLLGDAPLRSSLIGKPVVLGLLVPLYATVRCWSSLKELEASSLKRFFRVVREQDRVHLG